MQTGYEVDFKLGQLIKKVSKKIWHGCGAYVLRMAKTNVMRLPALNVLISGGNRRGLQMKYMHAFGRGDMHDYIKKL